MVVTVPAKAALPLLTGKELNDPAVARLWNMMRSCRPFDSDTEMKVMKELLRPLGVTEDKFGNVYKKIGKDPGVAWVCHTDTVHSGHGYQFIDMDEEQNIILDAKSKMNCLGADDTSGMFLMIEMIRARRPGLYIFHRGEEVGCKGSRFIADKTPHMLNGINFCIAFDRMGMTDVITFQRGMRSCSDDFAQSLATKLGMGYRPDPTGVYTDSATYVDIVAECTNISVGYARQHSSSERQNIPHIMALRQVLLELDARDLVIKRKAGDKESRWKSNYSGGGYHYHGGYGGYYDGYHSETVFDRSTKVVNQRNTAKNDAATLEGGEVDEFSISGRNFCPEYYTGWFYKDDVQVRCTYTAWETRKREVDALKRKRSAPALTVVKGQNTTGSTQSVVVGSKSDEIRQVNALSAMLRNYSYTLAIILNEWGFTADMLADEIADREAASKIAAAKVVDHATMTTAEGAKQ